MVLKKNNNARKNRMMLKKNNNAQECPQRNCRARRPGAPAS